MFELPAISQDIKGNYMSLLQLQDKADAIDKIVKSTIKSDTPNTEPITDGIIDIEKYFNAKFKILWILKEPYDSYNEDGIPCGGNWCLKELIREKRNIEDFKGEQGWKTFEPMIYVSWSILNNFSSWDYIPNVETDPTILNTLENIAYINVKKLPGYKTSSSLVIEDAYKQYKEILLKQIEDYNPDIIIGGGTLHHFFSDLGFTREQMQQSENTPYYILKNNKIYIDTYHPANRGNREEYCQGIINAVKIWASDLNP
ncbi:MAG: hypothetical protein WBP45_12980 [Daejeonella sp.]